MTSVAQVVEVNGQPDIVVLTEGCVQSVMTFEVVEGCIQSIYSMRNPEKLKPFIDAFVETSNDGNYTDIRFDNASQARLAVNHHDDVPFMSLTIPKPT